MKNQKVLQMFFVSVLILFSSFANGQNCTGPTGVPGLSPQWECLPCVERNVAYSEDVQIENFGTVSGITITSLKVDSIKNIPFGLSYSMNPSSGILPTSTAGCITFSGTTAFSAGTYQLGIYITVEMAGLGNLSGEASEVVDNLITLGILDTTAAPAPDFEYFLKIMPQGGTCTVGSPCQGCNASFTYTNTGNTYTFQNTSYGTNLSYLWTFGMGQGTSTLQNATHTYTAPGTYVVRLGIGNSTGCVDTSIVVINVSGTGPCNADFSYSVNGRNVAFNNTSANYTSLLWTFGDAGTSTQQNPSHTYSVDGTYQACLTIVDSTSSCTDSVCQTILISGTTSQFYCISGNVGKGNGTDAAFPATVYLIYSDTTLGTLTAVSTTSTDQNGDYQFCNVPVGEYLVKAALDSGATGYNAYIPTYFGNSLYWAYAAEVFLNHNFQQIDIWLIAGNNTGGPGFIGGNVSQGANKMLGPGDPLEAIQIMLLDEFDNPVQYIYSDANGSWNFSGVAYGTYKVYAEVPGLPTYPYMVTIGPQNETVDNIALIIESTQVISGVGSMNVNLHSVNIYPNPTNDALNVDFVLVKSTELTVRITDITGKIITEEAVHAQAGNQALRFDLSPQQPGVYLVQIAGKDNFKTFKVMKY